MAVTPRIEQAPRCFIERKLGIHHTGVDRQARAFGREALLSPGVTEIVANEIQEICRIFSIMDREAAIKADPLSVFAKQARADRVEGP